MLKIFKNSISGEGGFLQMMAIALPMVISNASETIMTFTDRIFLSRLGSAEMSAAMGGGLTVFMMMSFFLGLTGYSTAIVAQYLGSKKKDKCPLTAVQAILISIIAYPIILIASPLAHLFFDFMNIPEEQIVSQRLYFNILIYGVIFSLLRNSFSGFFSGIGRTRVVMFSALTAMVFNIIFNYLLIFGKCGFPELGIKGAAIGTVIGSFLGFVVMIIFYFSPRNCKDFSVLNALKFDMTIMKKLFSFGYPAGLEFFLNLLAFTTMIFIFSSQGIVTASAITIVFNWDMVSFVPLIGVNIGVTSLVGRYMGAGLPDIAHRSTMSGLKLAWIYSFCILLAFSIFPYFLVGIFRPEINSELFNSEIFPLSVSMLRLSALYVMADAVFLVIGGALKGAGDTLWTMRVSVGFHWLLVLVIYILLYSLRVQINIAWLMLCIIFMLFSMTFYLRYRSGKWKKIRIIEPPLPVTEAFHETL